MLPTVEPWKRFGFQPADLEDELGVAVVHHADLGVGCFALIAIAKPAAQAEYGLGKRRSWRPCHSSSRLGSASGRCPSGGHPGCRYRRCRSPRTNASCNGRGSHDTAVAVPGRARCQRRVAQEGSSIGLSPMLFARLVAEGSRYQEFAELTRLDGRRGQGPVVAGAALGAVLDDSIIAPGGLDGDSGLRECCGCTVSRRRHLYPPGSPRS